MDLLELLGCLMRLIKSVCSRVINPMAKIKVLKEPIDGPILPRPYLHYISESAQLNLSPEENCVKMCELHHLLSKSTKSMGPR